MLVPHGHKLFGHAGNPRLPRRSAEHNGRQGQAQAVGGFRFVVGYLGDDRSHHRACAGVDPEDDSWSVSVNLSIPLFEGGATSFNIQQTKIEIQKMRNQKAQLLQSLELNVRAAVLDLVNKRVNLISSKRSAEFSKKSLELVQDSYARGKVSIVDLLEAQNSSLSEELKALNSVYELMASLLETERAVGKFTLLTSPTEQDDYFKRLQQYFNEHSN